MADDITNDDGYQFDDDTSNQAEAPAEETKAEENVPAPAADQGSTRGSTGGGRYAQELMSKTIQAKFRTFYIDLKESSNGKFVKISEKSHGRKSTIMMDGEDVAPMIEALQEIQKEL